MSMISRKFWWWPSIVMPLIVAMSYIFFSAVFNTTFYAAFRATFCASLCSAIGWKLLLAVVPSLLLSVAMFHSAKNIKSGKFSKFSAYLYYCELIAPYVWVGILSMFEILPFWTMVVFLTLPVAIGSARTMTRSFRCGVDALEGLEIRTATLQTVFSLLLALSYIVSKFINF